LEEPEAHLHPSAIRALWQLVEEFGGQKLVSTHSGDFIADVDIGNIRRLARTPDGLRSFRVPTDLLSTEETRKFNYHIRQARGELLFARCWLLVEGETETWVYSAAARAMGLNLHREGVRLVEYRQADVGLMAKVANALGIAWFCVGDDDGERNNTEPKVLANLGSAAVENRIAFPYSDIETRLLSNGYDDLYQRHMPNQNLERVKMSPDDSNYWREYARHLPNRAKTRAAAGCSH
jgi:putative ATP-dependent endonuclease of OLD family